MKRIWKFVIVISTLILVLAAVRGAPARITHESTLKLPERLEMLEEKKLVDYTKKPQKARVEPVQKPESKPKPVVTVSGSWVEKCQAWAKMAGVPLNGSAITLLSRESKCDPTIRNPYSSAGGIPQALPWTKMGCRLEVSDEAAICQLRWFYDYVIGRYGSYENALAHSYRVGWY